MGPNFSYFDLKIGFRQIIRTWPEPNEGDRSGDCNSGTICLASAESTENVSNTQNLPAKTPIFRLPYEDFQAVTIAHNV